MNDFKQTPQAKLRLPEEARREERAATREAEKPAIGGTKPPYADMASAPKDTRPIMLWADDKTPHECIWRITRSYDRPTSKWGGAEFWAMVHTRNTPIEFEPIGWSRI